MAGRQRSTHSTTFNAQVSVAALRGDKTIEEVAEKFEVHPNQVTAWKAQLLERSSEAFDEEADGTTAPNIEKMEAKIGSPFVSDKIYGSKICDQCVQWTNIS